MTGPNEPRAGWTRRLARHLRVWAVVLIPFGCGDEAVDTCSERKCPSTRTISCGPTERDPNPCRTEPLNEGQRCNVDGVSGVCRNGVCGAPDLCEGVDCEDDDPCTIDECAFSGKCVFTPVDCIDDNYCTEDWCDPDDRRCVHRAKANGTDCGCLFGGSCSNGVCDCEPPRIEIDIP